MEDTKFLNVFSKIKLSANVKSVLKATNVVSVKMNKKECSLKIYLESENVINENCLKDFKDDIFDNFKIIKDIEIDLKYNLDSLSLHKKIEKIWENIAMSIDEKSPMCFVMFKDASFRLDNNKLCIELPKNSLFIFELKNMDKFIRKIIKDRLKEDIVVEFSEKSQGRINKENELKCALEKSLEEKKEQFKEPIVSENTNRRYTPRGSLKIKKYIEDEIMPIKNSIKNNEMVTVCGEIFLVNIILTKKGKNVVTVDIMDDTYAVSFKFFTTPDIFEKEYENILKKGNFITVKGSIKYDEYAKELILMSTEICETTPPQKRMDTCEEKRVELHLHTQMSKLDAISSVKDIMERASLWGHTAIAITDHGVVQAFPEAMDMSKKYGIKALYGMEAYIVDDLVDVVENSKNQSLFDEYVVFDLETTGLSNKYNKMIEIGAVKIKNGEIIDRFSEFINPHEKLPENIVNLTGITDEDLQDALDENEVLPKFFAFFSDAILVAHNADFDMGFIKKWADRNGKIVPNTVLDTVGLSRTIFPDMAKHTLKNMAKRLDVELINHHRAVDDAKATSEIFIKCINILKNEYNTTTLDGINDLARVRIDVKKLRPNHAILFAKTQTGLRNLYELVSISHLDFFYREPRIPKSKLMSLREGLIIGTACENGEFYQAVLNNENEENIEKIAKFYDYFEIQPIANNTFLIDNERVAGVNSIEDLQNINKKIVEYGKKYDKIVVATGDVHFLDEREAQFREVIMASTGFKKLQGQPPLYLKTTDEMLDEFAYLGESTAYDVVVKNTNIIKNMIDDIKPIPDGTFPPEIEGADDELREITYKRAKEIYSESLPQIVKERLEKELNSIIKNGFAVLYIIAQKVVWHSNDNGYIVGSRGSVGSSFVATMAGITEVNPLSPHYFCKKCKYSDFTSQDVIKYAGNSGWDLPDKICPNCNEKLYKDGHDIPFETFLGFEGDKEPDIDLNFSGEFQTQAHQYTEKLFGKDHVFKAGTIGTLAQKTAYGYVKKYMELKEMVGSSAEINRLTLGCVGIKKTTGQHPGGLMVVPNDKSIYDFCPVQRPADDNTSNVITTHFDYHSISGRILKLDLLGHDVPTILRMLKDFTQFEPLDAPMDDKATMSLFTSPKALGVTEDMIHCKTGSLGLPEFGTQFVIQMLVDTNPTTFSDLVKISGLSHGTDVWFNNAQDLIKDNVATLKEVIPTRDDIMVYLILKGVENKLSFTIMEAVRKGKGLTPEAETIMLEKNVPKWYIESCKKIKYMFPKGHAVAYVTNAFRMGYFKINYPYAFYASLFSVKVEDFDYDVMCFGQENVEKLIEEIQKLGKQATTKEKSKLTVLELVREMYKRGFKFVKMDLYKSKGFKFDITQDGILPPLFTAQGLGEAVVKAIVEEREKGEFETIEDLVHRAKISKTAIDVLKKNKVLEGIPDTNQLTLF